MHQRYIEIMDTTLRDGEQTTGVSFTGVEKLNIAKILLEEVKVDRIEIASAGISKGEYEGAKQILQWAKEKGHEEKIEILGFIDQNKSIDWILNVGGKVLNLLSKGSENHLKNQLRKTVDEHIREITENILYAQKHGLKVNLYLEDWSNGMRNARDYVFNILNQVKDLPIERFMLADTLGILHPEECFQYFKLIGDQFPELHLDVHAHNDYDLAVSNCSSAIKAGAIGVHTTVNGLGERAGNTPLASMVAVLNDHHQLSNSVDENKLIKASKMVAAFAKLRIPSNKPIVGANVFTQTCGVHADGDQKAGLYQNHLSPERFGTTRKYALGKTSGKANILKNLEELGIELSLEEMKKVTDRVVELGDLKETITPDDLPFIMSDVLGSNFINDKVKIKNYYSSRVYNMKPFATINILIDGKSYEADSSGDGQYDAFMKALNKIYTSLGKDLPDLVDYEVTIPPGGRTDALVETVITWNFRDREFKTRGLESDQQAAAVTATIKMLNIIEEID